MPDVFVCPMCGDRTAYFETLRDERPGGAFLAFHWQCRGHEGTLRDGHVDREVSVGGDDVLRWRAPPRASQVTVDFGLLELDDSAAAPPEPPAIPPLDLDLDDAPSR